jgi:2-ketoarginine methyltransferase
MSAAHATERAATRPRPAFDLFEGFMESHVLAALEMAGALSELEAEGIRPAAGTDQGALLAASLRYLEQRGLVEEDGGTYVLTERGRSVCADKGYLVWLVGGYGESLRHLESFLSGRERYGVDMERDGRWVAGGAALIGRKDVVPAALGLLETTSFRRALDLGCGNARFLVEVCRRFGCDGVGVDISPEACAEAVKRVDEAGMSDRVQIVCADANDVASIPEVEETDLVIAFFLLHEISSVARESIVRFLSDLGRRLPAQAHLLVAEVSPARGDAEEHELFTPEFDFVHAVMRQSLLSRDSWRDVLSDGGFAVREIADTTMPGAMVILAETEAAA